MTAERLKEIEDELGELLAMRDALSELRNGYRQLNDMFMRVMELVRDSGDVQLKMQACEIVESRSSADHYPTVRH